MTATEDRLGGRLPLIHPDSLAAEQRELYDHMRERQIPWAQDTGFAATTSEGRLIGPFNPVLYTPRIGLALLGFMEALGASSSLDPRTQQVVILAVGSIWGARYELYAHSAEARHAGLTEDEIAALASGQIPETLGDGERLAARIARQMVSDRAIDDALYAGAQARFESRQLVDVVLLVGYYQTICGLLNAFAIPVPGARAGNA